MNNINNQAQLFMIFVGGLLITMQFGWQVGLGLTFFVLAIRPRLPPA